MRSAAGARSIVPMEPTSSVVCGLARQQLGRRLVGGIPARATPRGTHAEMGAPGLVAGRATSGAIKAPARALPTAIGGSCLMVWFIERPTSSPIDH